MWGKPKLPPEPSSNPLIMGLCKSIRESPKLWAVDGRNLVNSSISNISICMATGKVSFGNRHQHMGYENARITTTEEKEVMMCVGEWVAWKLNEAAITAEIKGVK